VANALTTQQVIALAKNYLGTLNGHAFDVLEVKKPVSPDAAVNLAKIVSKLSPIVGNLIEFNTCEFLNDKRDFAGHGIWRRQDPGFPDIVFDGNVKPTPGFEIKAWFPLATEITARFKDSQNHFVDDRTYVAMIAWLPEYLIFGRPKVLGVVVASGASVAEARDSHYHNPPDYLVLEPEDTSKRTRNLQQTNTNGYKWQHDDDPQRNTRNRERAEEIVKGWGKSGGRYSPKPEYQALLRDLMGKFKYRLDTNFAKMDRIGHAGIEAFADHIYAMRFHGMPIGDWNALLSSDNTPAIREALSRQFEIKDTSERLIR
jgi:hypothetical protein